MKHPAGEPRSPRRLRIFPLIGGALFLFCLWGYFELAEDYPESRYRALDEGILRALRTPGDPAVPRGPLWLKDVMRDISALGSAAVLVVVVTGVTGYLLLARRWRCALTVLLAGAGGALLNGGLKILAARPRPEIVPHLTEATSSSFPSGHSMLSAIVYLSIGVTLAKNLPQRHAGGYIIVFAAVLAFAVGCTRVYLGVHYPSDVLAGWIAGIAWTLLCLAAQARPLAPEPRTAKDGSRADGS